ncbi:MAG TPA: AraC family transcriptional regulator [Gaiellales bacterium]|nr:AraC family transcriptional regulator [Gaiellales bacterium]
MKPVVTPRSPDLVADLLGGVRVRSAVFCRSEMGAPWGFAVAAHGNPSFHVVTRGRCWLEVAGEGQQRPLRAGDLVILPAGPKHWMRDEPGSPTPWLDDILATAPMAPDRRLRYGGDGPRTDLVCGGFVLEGADLGPVVAALPPVIHVAGADGRPVPWLAASLELVAAVAGSDTPGAEAVLRRLADTMLVQALRVAVAELAAADQARATALRDPRIAAAVRLVHHHPERPWTVAALAAEVAYSRSAFTARFREATGESPMSYLTRIRLANAAALLVGTDATIGVVSRRCGYRNEFAFSRAFKRSFGVSPGAYRTSRASAERTLAAAGS